MTERPLEGHPNVGKSGVLEDLGFPRLERIDP